MQEKYFFQTVPEHENHRLSRAFVDVKRLCSRVEPQKATRKIKPRSGVSYLEPAIQSTTSPWSAVNFKKTADLDKVQLEPAIWSRDTGQRIPCFDRCQLTITLMSNIKDVYCKLATVSNGVLPPR